MAPTTINKKKTANDWINEAMADCVIAVSDKVPKGWVTLQEIADHYGVCITTMNARIQKALRKRKIKRKKYRINTGRCVSPVWHYYKR
jgi:mannose/fructose/N-acetylgalactosamine-specific phosphotransferase system component IIB